MKSVLTNIQVQTKVGDTIPISLLVPATKITSSEGAIIPKEAIAWTEIQPYIPVKKEEESMFSTYVIIGVVIIGVYILVRILSRKRRKQSI
jgi:hypothetical protein